LVWFLNVGTVAASSFVSLSSSPHIIAVPLSRIMLPYNSRCNILGNFEVSIDKKRRGGVVKSYWWERKAYICKDAR